MSTERQPLARVLGWTSGQLAAFCERWRVKELAVFGSAARGSLQAGSDLDVMVDFAEDASWSLFDVSVMEDELEAASGRPVDLFTRQAVEASENPIRRNQILSTARVLYAA